MPERLSGFLLLLLLWSLATTARAAVLHVPADFESIQAAIDAAVAGDTVRVGPGTYFGQLRMKQGVAVRGSGAERTILDGDGEEIHVVIFNPVSEGEISGFTVRNGGRAGIVASRATSSQGIVRIRNCFVENNNRGIVLSSQSHGEIVNCRITNNTEEGIELLTSATGKIVGNLIVGNGRYGIKAQEGFGQETWIANNTIADNGGPAVRLLLGRGEGLRYWLCNNIISHNRGGVILSNPGPESPLVRMRLSHNNVWQNVGGFFFPVNGSDYIESFRDPAWQPPTFPPGVDPIPTTIKEIVRGFEPPPATGHQQTDPLFVNAASGDYRLAPDSPLVDAGAADTTGFGLEALDLAGMPRLTDGDGDGRPRIDIGAYESAARPTAVETEQSSPFSFALEQNHPNPFNASTRIAFELGTNTTVRLTVHNLSGQRLRTLWAADLTQGDHTIHWDGLDGAGQQAATGIYLYRLETPDHVQTRKMLLVR